MAKKVQVRETTVVNKRRRKGKGEAVGRIKKSTTTRSDGTKTVTKLRKDGTLKKKKEFAAGKKKANTITKKRNTMAGSLTTTKTYKKGVRGATITKKGKKLNINTGNVKKVDSVTTRKSRRKAAVRGVGNAIKTGVKVAAGAALAASPVGKAAGLLAAKTSGALMSGATIGTVAGSVGRGAKRIAKKVGKTVKKAVKKKINKIKSNRRNPNRKRM